MNELFLKTEDNTNIAINHYDNGKNEVIIIAPGWFMCKDSRVFKLMAEDFFKDRDVICMDFRGHGKSSGVFSFTTKETMDIKAVIEYAKKTYLKIYLIGFSLGGALVLIHTARYNDVHKVIAVSAPTDYNKIENHWFRPEAFVPTMQKFEFFRAFSIRVGNPFLVKIKPVDVVQNITCAPLLFLAGEKDPTVYPWHSEALYYKAHEPKSFEIFEKCYHAEDLYLQSHDKFMNLCNTWLNQ